MLELIVVDGPQQGQTIRLNFEKAWFGRLPTCDFVFFGDGISRIHFSIQKRGDDYVLVDNKSTNGTFVNGVQTVAVTLREGYEITVGATRLRVRNVETIGPLPFRFSLHWMGEEGGAQLIEQDSVLVGRKSLCQIQLNDPSVAAVHAQMDRRADGSVWIKDQSQGAGVYLNGQRIVEQQLRHTDVIGIGPFELSAALFGEVCHLQIRDCSAEAQPALENVPENYRGVVKPPGDAAGQEKPSAAIAAVPRWMQSKAPIWVPTSDILRNRFRAILLLVAVVGVLAWAGVAIAAKKTSGFSPGPLTEAHAAFACEACHTGGGRIADASCQGCHEGKTASPVHAQNHVGCAACHTEHHGAAFDLARDVGAGCQAAGCHVTVHAAEKRFLASQPRPDQALKIPPAVALAAHFEAGDAMHDKHAGLSAGCAACHTGGDPGLLEAKPDQPGARGKELKDIRMRCLACHGFGPEATLTARCYSCHLEHPTEKAEILTVLRFPDAPSKPIGPIQSRMGGLLTLAGAAVALPLLFVAGAAGGVILNQRRLKAETKKRIESAAKALSVSRILPVPSGLIPGGAAPKPTDNQAPRGQQRPRIDLDLCVGCGTCVHVCPFNVLEIVNEKAIAVRLDDCTGYAACAAECPTEAITLVTGGAMQLQELPNYDTNLETNVPGLYLAGEVTGKALIKVAINQGKNVVDSIMKNPPDRSVPYDVIVVGAGPAGTSAALSALKEGLRVVLLEQGNHANTIRTYPRQKFVMAEPVMIPLFGPLWMEDTSKETLLEKWNEIIGTTGLVINEEEKVLRVVRAANHFEVHTSKAMYAGSRVVLAIGKRGSPRKLGVPGEESAKVAYNLLDADAYRGKAICVVGGGDSGLEAACGLARPDLGCRVWLVHRLGDFGKAKPRNQKKIKKCMDEGRISVFFESGVAEIRERSVVINTPAGAVEIENDFVFVMVGGENPKKFLAECGIEFSQRALG
jgi:thioredoxin reductase (NADPH)